jgi:hypothetical protein
MPKKQVTISRKIEIRINTTNKDEKDEYYRTLRAWRDVACNGANMAISAMYTTLKGENITYLEKKLESIRGRSFDFEDLEKKAQRALSKDEDQPIYELIKQEKKDLFITSELAFYYRMLALYYKDAGIPTAIISCISSQVMKDFTSDKSDYLRNNQSLRTYKKKMPIPFTSASIRHIHRSIENNPKNGEEKKVYKDFCFTLFGIPLRTHFGRDKSNNYHLLNEAFSMHFLPDAIKDAQKRLSDRLLESRAAGNGERTNLYMLGDIIFSAEYENREDDTEKVNKEGEIEEHRYVITATVSCLDANKQPVTTEHKFLMIPCKIDKKDAYKIASNYKLGDSKIQLMEKQEEDSFGKKYERTKIFLLASLTFDKEPWKLDEDSICYCELDPEIPIKGRVGNKKFQIGNKEEFQYRRTGIQGAYRKHQINLAYNNGGRGRAKKLQALDKYKTYEKDVVSDKIHNYTNRLIKICLDNNCKYIYLCAPKKPVGQDTEEEKYLIRNWSYGQVQMKIESKASRYNIEVVTYESE